jgi:hypothetical protein
MPTTDRPSPNHVLCTSPLPTAGLAASMMKMPIARATVGGDAMHWNAR